MIRAASQSVLHLVSLTIIGFVFLALFIVYSYSVFLNDIEEILRQEEMESKKMQINSQLMELARSRTRLTSKIIDTKDPFVQDELNMELETYAAQFSRLRERLLEFPLREEEEKIIEHNDKIIPIILPAQRSVVEMAMNNDSGDDELAKKVLYEVVLPGQKNLVENLGALISEEQRWITSINLSSFDLFQNMRRRNYQIIILTVLVSFLVAVIIVFRIRNIQNTENNLNQQLEQARDNLEEKVKERTHQLDVLNEKLRESSERDELSGLYNRRKFNDYIQYETDRSRRQKVPLSIIIADIDYFKTYNDNYGHQKGDKCIKSVAGAISSSLRRKIDFVARYGGEEFVAILPDTDIHNAGKVAQGVLDAVSALKIPHKYSDAAKYVTMSIGVACFDGGSQTNIVDTIELADKRLYVAKKQGRNQVVASN